MVSKTITNEQTGKLVLTEDTSLKVVGEVHLTQILCKDNCRRLTISGDVLYVDNPNHGIAIGNDATWNTASGEFMLSNLVTDIYIDCKEIHAHSKTPNCGIGSYSLVAAQSTWFSQDCEVIDTPKDMVIVKERLNEIGVYSRLPEYMTVVEYSQKYMGAKTILFNNLLCDLANTTLVDLIMENMNKIKDDKFTEADLMDFTMYISAVVSKVTQNYYSRFLQRVYGSLTSAILYGHTEVASQYSVLYNAVACVCLARELELFDKVTRYPLALRYSQIIHDLTFDKDISSDDVSNITSFGKIHLNEELLKHYNHPDDRSYYRDCRRDWYGVNMYNWNENYNELISPNDPSLVKAIPSTLSGVTYPDCVRGFENPWCLEVDRTFTKIRKSKIEFDVDASQTGSFMVYIGSEEAVDHVYKLLNKSIGSGLNEVIDQSNANLVNSSKNSSLTTISEAEPLSELYIPKVVDECKFRVNALMVTESRQLRAGTYSNFYDYITKVVAKFDSKNYAGGIQRLFISHAIAMLDTISETSEEIHNIAQTYQSIAAITACVCLCKETVLFDKLTRFPLCMRYVMVMYHMAEYMHDTDINSLFLDLGLTDEVVKNYNHDDTRNYSSKLELYTDASRGYKWNDRFNELVPNNDLPKLYLSCGTINKLGTHSLISDGVDSLIAYYGANQFVYEKNNNSETNENSFVYKLYQRLKHYGLAEEKV